VSFGAGLISRFLFKRAEGPPLSSANAKTGLPLVIRPRNLRSAERADREIYCSIPRTARSHGSSCGPGADLRREFLTNSSCRFVTYAEIGPNGNRQRTVRLQALTLTHIIGSYCGSEAQDIRNRKRSAWRNVANPFLAVSSFRFKPAPSQFE
jgi:hypothetical protein